MEITQAIVDQFRVDFEGFANATNWPDSKITRALQKADKETGSTRWGDYEDLSNKQSGMFNYAAHLLTVSAASAKATTAGGSPSSIAAVQSKSVGDESVTYAVESMSGGDAALAATSYGQEFLRLRRRVAAGGASSLSMGARYAQG